MDNMVCAVCGKIVARLEVCEGENRFHLDCYVSSKRQARKP